MITIIMIMTINDHDDQWLWSSSMIPKWRKVHCKRCLWIGHKCQTNRLLGFSKLRINSSIYFKINDQLFPSWSWSSSSLLLDRPQIPVQWIAGNFSSKFRIIITILFVMINALDRAQMPSQSTVANFKAFYQNSWLLSPLSLQSIVRCFH